MIYQMFKITFFLLFLKNNKNIFNFNNTLNLKTNNFIFNGEERYNTFFIENSYFSRINTLNGNGGIIYNMKMDQNMNLNQCIFYFCSSTEGGGAIFFLGNNVKLLKICCSYCFSEIYQFGYIETSLNGFYHLLSINNCYNISEGFNSFVIDLGNITLKNYNSSKNINKERSGIWISFPSNFYSIFCSIINNFVSSNTILLFQGYEKYFLSYYNIINNNSPHKYFGVFSVFSGIFYLKNSFLINNKDFLFKLEEGQLEVSYCKINHNINKIFNGNILNNNNEINNYLINNN